MSNPAFSAIENQMVDFDFSALQARAQAVNTSLATAASVGDIKTQICSVWSKISQFVKLLENVPVAGKYITILANLLDAICKP
jgi:hypothetical protein